MTLITLQFILFLVLTAALYYLLPGRFRSALLLAASVYFYWTLAPQYLPWLLLSAFSVWLLALLSAKERGRTASFVLSAAGAAIALGSLIYFKYLDFICEILMPGRFAEGLGIVAPLGLSFYTLQAAGYVIDVRRGDTEPEKNPLCLISYLIFFPHIMSGPIASAKVVLPQFSEPRGFDFENALAGVRRFFLGAFKKLVIADFAGLFVDAVYSNIYSENPLSLAAAALLYGIQLYFDFSAYTDMALGAARVLGFELEENFRAPYFSSSVTEIWTRWHITLTNWLRNYVYFPLGGSRRGFPRKIFNICLVFIVSGLWHGAGWAFVIWGLIFALLRALEELARLFLTAKPASGRAPLKTLLGRLYTYLSWCFAFIFFRLGNAEKAFEFIGRIFSLGEWSLTLAVNRFYLILMNIEGEFPAFAKAALFSWCFFTLLLLALEYVFVYRGRALTARPNDLLSQLGEWPRFALELLMLAAALAFGVFGASSFVYFQF